MISKKVAQRLVETFVGETVIFYLKNIKVSAVSEDGESVSFAGMIDGYVVDVDEYFFYLGDETGNVDRTIAHDMVGITQIANLNQQIFQYEMPENDEEIH